jgi:hypothetical protein
MKMDVGILTIHNHHNYGAALQAYALNYAIRRMGHQCRTIDCTIDPGHGRQIKWTKHVGAQITNIYNCCRIGANRLHDRRFRDFGAQYIPLTDRTYERLNQLIENPPPFDVFVTGSDQVWRPSLLNREIGDIYHLCFASPRYARLVSYAPSFGVNRIPKQYHKRISHYLKH